MTPEETARLAATVRGIVAMYTDAEDTIEEARSALEVAAYGACAIGHAAGYERGRAEAFKEAAVYMENAGYRSSGVPAYQRFADDLRARAASED
jgi:hypothetical protein